MVAVPASAVLTAVEACGRAGRRVIVLYRRLRRGRWRWPGAPGRAVGDLPAVDLRLLGPNCIGALRADSEAPLNATFGPVMPAPGPVALATQSGALGLAAVEFATRRGLGFSSVVSLGNKADLSGNDLLGFWARRRPNVGHPC